MFARSVRKHEELIMRCGKVSEIKKSSSLRCLVMRVVFIGQSFFPSCPIILHSKPLPFYKAFSTFTSPYFPFTYAYGLIKQASHSHMMSYFRSQ